MSCRSIKLPNGGVAIVCGVKPVRKRCGCGEWATRECDWCDKPLCIVCCRGRRGEVDACSEHLYELQEREAIQEAEA